MLSHQVFKTPKPVNYVFMYKKKKRNVKSTFLMSNIYVFYVSVSASGAKRRKFEEGIG